MSSFETNVRTEYSLTVAQSMTDSPVMPIGQLVDTAPSLRSMLAAALIRAGDDTFLNPDSKPTLEAIARFMDANPHLFKKPDSGSWVNELREDDYLNKPETKQFEKAIGYLQACTPPDPVPCDPYMDTEFRPRRRHMHDVALQDRGQGLDNQYVVPNAHGNTFPEDPHAMENLFLRKNGWSFDGWTGQMKSDDKYFLNPAKSEGLTALAKYMDMFPDTYGKPDGRSNWVSELSEDLKLNRDEAKTMRKALEDYQATYASGIGTLDMLKASLRT